jgi:hypothetical protein
MEFKTKKSFRITRFLFAIIPSLLIGLLIFLNTSPRVLHTGVLFIFFLFGMLGFDYFNSSEGEPSGKEKMKTDKSYRIKTYRTFLALIIILFVFEILRYITLIKL